MQNISISNDLFFFQLLQAIVLCDLTGGSETVKHKTLLFSMKCCSTDLLQIWTDVLS